MKKRALALVAVLSIALGACAGDDPAADETATPTTSPPATSAPPASGAPASEAPASQPPASEEPAAGPTEGKPSPAEAAQAFYSDWNELDRASAAGYATQEVIDEAFAGSPPQAEFVDCTEEGDHFACFYYYEGGGLGITVRDSDAYGFIVTDIGYVAD